MRWKILKTIKSRSKIGGIKPYIFIYALGRKKKLSINKRLLKFSKYKTENNNIA